MKHYQTILTIGITEIFIGGITFLLTIGSLVLSVNQKSPNVLTFVIVTSIISSLIGIGILKFNKVAYQTLLYFSSVILLSKILILMDIIQLNGELETTIHPDIKSGISILYHGFVIFYLQRAKIREIFQGQR